MSQSHFLRVKTTDHVAQLVDCQVATNIAASALTPPQRGSAFGVIAAARLQRRVHRGRRAKLSARI